MPTSNFVTSDREPVPAESNLESLESRSPWSDDPAVAPSDWFQSVSREAFDAAPTASPRRFATPHGLMPKWLLGLAWIGLGLPTMALSVYTIAMLFLTNIKPTTPTGEVNHELLWLVFVAAGVNFCALVLFSILGRETARHQRSRRRRQWER